MERLIYVLAILPFSNASVTNIHTVSAFMEKILDGPGLTNFETIAENNLTLSLMECAALMSKAKDDLAILGAFHDDNVCQLRKFPPFVLKPQPGGLNSKKVIFFATKPFFLEQSLLEKVKHVLFLDESNRFFKEQYHLWEKGWEMDRADPDYLAMTFSEISPFPGPFGTLAWNVLASYIKSIQARGTSDTKKFTVLFWYRADSDPSTPHLLMKNDKFEFMAEFQGTQNHQIVDNSGIYKILIDIGDQAFGSWAHIGLTHDTGSSERTVQYFLNGVKVGEKSDTRVTASIGTTAFTLADSTTKGHLASVLFSDQVLDEEEVQAFMSLK